MENLVIVFVNDSDPTNPEIANLCTIISARAIRIGKSVTVIDNVGQLAELLGQPASGIYKVFVIGQFEFPRQTENLLRENELMGRVIPIPSTGAGTRRLFLKRRNVGAFTCPELARNMSLGRDLTDIIAHFLPMPVGG